MTGEKEQDIVNKRAGPPEYACGYNQTTGTLGAGRNEFE